MMSLRIAAVVAAMAVALWAAGKKNVSLRPGDVVIEYTSATSGMAGAIIAASAQGESVAPCHVGILSVDSAGCPVVVEASPRHGVTATPLGRFLASADSIGGRPAVRIMRVDDADGALAAARAMTHIGEPYDWMFAVDNGAMYCSELVQVAYGTDIFPYLKLNFLDASGAMPEYWARLYERLGCEAPQGQPGTSPQQQAMNPRLRLVYSYF